MFRQVLVFSFLPITFLFFYATCFPFFFSINLLSSFVDITPPFSLIFLLLFSVLVIFIHVFFVLIFFSVFIIFPSLGLFPGAFGGRFWFFCFFITIFYALLASSSLTLPFAASCLGRLCSKIFGLSCLVRAQLVPGSHQGAHQPAWQFIGLLLEPSPLLFSKILSFFHCDSPHLHISDRDSAVLLKKSKKW